MRDEFTKLLVVGVVFALLLPPAMSFQKGYIEMDGESFPPADPRERAEWTFARFHYDLGDEYYGFRFQRWKADYPKADRQFVRGVKRLTRIESRSTETVVDANDDGIYEWPWVYVEDPGAWQVSNQQAARLREYLLRGGFIMFDDSHGDIEWEAFVEGLRKILPDREVEDLGDDDAIFHVVYDLDDRVQIPGTRYVWGSRRYTPDSAIPKWRGVRDDKGRLLVAICHNSDVGDAWEWADSSEYPEKAASVAYRIGVNYIIYAMTH